MMTEQKVSNTAVIAIVIAILVAGIVVALAIATRPVTGRTGADIYVENQNKPAAATASMCPSTDPGTGVTDPFADC
jgi:hypothetical protein